MKKVSLYTDGACSGNPGVGGIGAILEYNGKTCEISDAFPDTTNNRMELTAVIRGLELLKEPCEVTVFSDSKYFCDALSLGWLHSWKSRGWKKADGKPTLNTDLWERICELSQMHKISVSWVKGHAGHERNEACDAMAVKAIADYKNLHSDIENVTQKRP